MFPRVKDIRDLSEGTEKKWMATVELVRLKDNKVIGFGAALCSNKEANKKSFDEYAILSMAQTRAIGKAYRNVIGWIMKLAGYEATPKEEMTKVNGDVIDIKTEPIIETSNSKGIYPCVGYQRGKSCPGGIKLTKAQNDYSMRVYKKALCSGCQAGIKNK